MLCIDVDSIIFLLEWGEHISNGKGPHLILPPVNILAKGQGMDRPDLHILPGLCICLFFGLSVEDQIQNLQIRMRGGDHLKGGSLGRHRP